MRNLRQEYNLPQILRQHRAIRQEVSDRIFSPIQSLENEGILYVFLVFQAEEVGQKDGGDSQTQLCGVALKIQKFNPQKKGRGEDSKPLNLFYRQNRFLQKRNPTRSPRRKQIMPIVKSSTGFCLYLVRKTFLITGFSM